MNELTPTKISYGLYVLTAHQDGKDNGCIINTACQVTTTPNQFTITVNKANYTHDMILATKKFTISVIAEDAAFGLFTHFGFQSGKNVNKFADFTDCRRGANGCNYITKGTNAFIAGWVTQTIDLGTHTQFIATVTDMDILSDTPSATYAYYHSNIKPKPKKKAPAEENKTVWRCKICNYEYVGEELPADYICPVCKHPASDFEKVS